MLQVDVVALTELTHVFSRRMAARGGGRILLVASLAAYQPTPLLGAYGAAKAYVLSFGESLNVELAPEVGVTVLSPGLMETEFFGVADYHPNPSMRRTMPSRSGTIVNRPRPGEDGARHVEGLTAPRWSGTRSPRKTSGPGVKPS